MSSTSSKSNSVFICDHIPRQFRFYLRAIKGQYLIIDTYKLSATLDEPQFLFEIKISEISYLHCDRPFVFDVFLPALTNILGEIFDLY